MSRLSTFCLIVVAVFMHIQNGFALSIDINPNHFDGLFENKVDITCEVDTGSGKNIKAVMLMELSRKNDVIAIIRQDSVLSNDEKRSGAKFQVEGDIATTASQSFLRVTVSNPQPEDAGLYTCLLYYMDTTGLLQETKTSDNLTVPDVTTALQYLVKKVADLESEMKIKDEKLEQLKKTQQKLSKQVETGAKIKRQMSRLEKEMKEQKLDYSNQTDQISELNDRVRVQEEKLEQQMMSLTQQVERENVTEAFTAVYSGSGILKAGDDFVYGDVIMSEGQGYNKISGVFTAPVAGYYQFHLSVMTYAKSHIYLNLNSNRGQKLLRMFSGNTGNWESHSQDSCVAKLDAGEQVNPSIHAIQGGFQVNKGGGKDRGSQFSGYLLKVL